jgi:hypothetical protein
MPPKPRQQGAKKATVKVPSSGGDGTNRRLLAMIGAAGLVLVCVALGYVLFGGGSSSSASGGEAIKQLEAAGCTVQTVKALPSNDHSVAVANGTSPKWNTSPPTNGPHYGQAAVWGSYPEPLLPAQVVHNLEHGGIFIQYGKDVPKATVDELQGFYESHRNGTLLAPLPDLGSTIAMGVWTTSSPSKPDTGTAHLAKCTTFDETAYAAFFDAYQFEGPERFPMVSLAPGS